MGGEKKKEECFVVEYAQIALKKIVDRVGGGI